jgi:cell division protein FtsW (lipid II flippase)
MRLLTVALDYIALVILIMMVALVVYGVIAVYSIPYEIAKARNHPHQDAIGAATWVSLFTLGLLWPFLWIWAMAYRPDRGWGFSANAPAADPTSAIADLERRVAALEHSRQVK